MGRKSGYGPFSAVASAALLIGLMAPTALADPGGTPGSSQAAAQAQGQGQGQAQGQGGGSVSTNQNHGGGGGGGTTPGLRESNQPGETVSPGPGGGGSLQGGTQGQSPSNPDGRGVDKPYPADGQPAYSQPGATGEYYDGNNGCGQDKRSGEPRETGATRNGWDDNNGWCGRPPTRTPVPQSSPTPTPTSTLAPQSSPTPTPTGTVAPQSSPTPTPTSPPAPESSPTPTSTTGGGGETTTTGGGGDTTTTAGGDIAVAGVTAEGSTAPITTTTVSSEAAPISHQVAGVRAAGPRVPAAVPPSAPAAAPEEVAGVRAPGQAVRPPLQVAGARATVLPATGEGALPIREAALALLAGAGYWLRRRSIHRE